jgi:glutamate 5-kinase
MSARRFWVRYAAESAGTLTLDAGAVRAVVKQRRSLLTAGITGVSGRFFGGDVVELHGPDSAMVARGVVAYDATELTAMIGLSTADLPADLRRPPVHAPIIRPRGPGRGTLPPSTWCGGGWRSDRARGRTL